MHRLLIVMIPLLLIGSSLALGGAACPSPGDGDGEAGEGEEEDDGDILVTCGDGDIDLGEACDGADLDGSSCEDLGYISGTLRCTAGCLLDRSDCSVQPDCGDGILNTSEVCEGLELRGETCRSQGRGDGTLACRPDCTFDVTGCSSCGNGFIEGDEQCDGPRVGGRTCQSEYGATATGTLTCNDTCTDVDDRGCELPFGGSCVTATGCSEFRFAAPGLPASACTAVDGTLSATPCEISGALGSCVTTVVSGATADELTLYVFADEAEAEARCTSAGGRWTAL